jgi:nicotinate phosphoribosyltransferase
MNQIIDSILDLDLYKITMQQAVLHQYPNAKVKYKFNCRNKDVRLSFLADEMREQVKSWSSLRLSEKEKSFLQTLDFIKPDYIEFLNNFRVDPSSINVEVKNGAELSIECEGVWANEILFELFILPTVNELYFKNITNGQKDKYQNIGLERLEKKLSYLDGYPNLLFAEFGTRRRFSKEWQKIVLEKILHSKYSKNLVGTSNVGLASEYGIKAIGTVAHEWTMGHIGLVDNIRQAQKRALHVWQQEYGHRLGIALTDTFSTNAFFQDFDFNLARAYDGVRQDSGNPYVFGDSMINHYKSIDIDPRRKTIVFSDGLNFPESLNIWKYFAGRIGVSFGIGTDLTNDIGLPSLNIVMKLIECNGKHCVKISDVGGKEMGDSQTLKLVKTAYNL